MDPETHELTRLFNPRLHRWTEHFKLEEGHIIGLTPTGRTTASLFHMNSPDRVELRLELRVGGTLGQA